MEGCFWKTLLLVGALSASGRCAPSHKPLSYAEAVEQGVANYNSKAEEDSLYRLLEAVPQPDWDPNSEGMQELKFIIKETVCPTGEEISLDKCDFKEDGVVRECTGDYFLGEKPPMAVLTCEAVGEMKEENGVEMLKEKEDETEDQKEEEEEDQDERSRKLKKFFRKVKKGIKKVFKKVVKAIFRLPWKL